MIILVVVGRDMCSVQKYERCVCSCPHFVCVHTGDHEHNGNPCVEARTTTSTLKFACSTADQDTYNCDSILIRRIPWYVVAKNMGIVMPQC